LKKYAAIIVNRAISAVDKVFHYAIPCALQQVVQVGSVVRVSFSHQELDGIVVDITDQLPDVEPDKIKDIIGLVSDKPLFSQELLNLACWLSDYYVSPRVKVLQAMLPAGLSLTGKLPQNKQIRRLYLAKETAQTVRGQKQQAVLVFVGEHQGAFTKDVLSATGAKRDVLRGLLAKGLIREEQEAIWEQESGQRLAKPPILTEEQKTALIAIKTEADGKNRPVLLFGITSSGKTEVYLRRAEQVIASGRQVLLLVPEIVLTPQVINFFQQRLKKPVAVLHSGLSKGERRQTWLGIASGHYDMVIGARSAIFAPLPALGLIIMDEEHENTYKQENTPRFHAREVAKERTRLTQAQLILGSATPDVESYYLAETGEYLLVTLKNRVSGISLPKLEIVDMREELRFGNKSIFSSLLQAEIADCLARGEQSVLFLNRRGFHTFVSCRECGYVVQCLHCAIAMTYHAGEAELKCHYCGMVMEMPKTCPQCGSRAIRNFGSGTERVAAEAAKLWPDAKIARLDRDSVSKKGSYERIYDDMQNGRIDILVGTQMVAKGLDFPKVTLVGVIAADTSLNLPELRSFERTFQLLTQVSGRSGRRGPGKVVIQTYQPQSRVLLAVEKQSYEDFYAGEIVFRKNASYPPFGKLVRLVLSGRQIDSLALFAKNLAGCLGQHLPCGSELWGPSAAPWAKIKDRYRYQIILNGPDLNLLRNAAKEGIFEWQQEFSPPRDILSQVDVEPLSMM